MSERAEKSLPVRELSVAEIDDVSGAAKSIWLPNLQMEIYAGKSGYGANMESGNFYYAIDVKNSVAGLFPSISNTTRTHAQLLGDHRERQVSKRSCGDQSPGRRRTRNDCRCLAQRNQTYQFRHDDYEPTMGGMASARLMATAV